MGGNAIPEARRINRAEYDEIVKSVGGEKFVAAVNGEAGAATRHVKLRLQEVKPYRLKAEFGDVDFVIDDRVDFADLWNRFRPQMAAVNGNTFSMKYRGVQVDIIAVPTEYIQTTLNYYAYNDLGNLMGVLARTMGLKYGAKGLFLRHKDANGNSVGDIYIATEMNEILPVLGLSPERYTRGFDTMEEMFAFIVSSPLYCKQRYLVPQQGNRHKKRDANRKTYLAFLEYIRGHADRLEVELEAAIDFQQQYLAANFPHVEEELARINQEHQDDYGFRQHFNGERVARVTGYKGKGLGGFMSFIRSLLTREEIAALTDAELHDMIQHVNAIWRLKPSTEDIETRGETYINEHVTFAEVEAASVTKGELLKKRIEQIHRFYPADEVVKASVADILKMLEQIATFFLIKAMRRDV